MCALIDKSNSIDSEVRTGIIQIQKCVEEINSSIQTNENELNFAGYHERYTTLTKMISHFNDIQYYRSVQNGRVEDPKKLLPLYFELMEHPCISAISKRGGTLDVFVTYRNRKIGFREFFMRQIQLRNVFTQFKEAISQLSFCVFENAKASTDRKSCYGTTSYGKNTYDKHPITKLISTSISVENTNTISGIKSILTQIFLSVCSEINKPISSKIARIFIAKVCVNQNVDNLIDDLFLMYYYTVVGREWSFANGNVVGTVSRHVSWCSYHMKDNYCIFLGQPCHSSIDCAFYLSKK